MAVTALDLITNTLLGIGVYSPGEPISAADSAVCLQELNTMIDSWSNESLMTYATLENTEALVPGKYQYTIGPGGDFNTTRPLRIIGSPGSCYVMDTNGNRYNLEVVPQNRWNLIGNITAVTANFPNTLFYDPQYPLGIINLYPVPNISWSLFFDSFLQLTDFTTLAAPMILPPGYQAAIQNNLKIEIWPHFKADGTQPSPLLLRSAVRSKAAVKRTNIREIIANYDSEIVSRAAGVFNIYTGSNRGGSM